MNSKARDTFVQRLIEIAGRLTTVDLNNDELFGTMLGRHCVMIGQKIGLMDDGIVLYNRLFEQIWAKLHCDGVFTKKSVDKDLKGVLVRAFEESENNNLPIYFDQFIESIENFAIDQVIYFP